MPDKVPFFQRLLLGGVLAAKAAASPVAFGAHAIAEDEKGRVLLVRHSYMQGWQLPGGGVGRGEPPDQAVLRELREEVGLTASLPPELFGLFSRRVGLITNLIALFRVRGVQIDFKPNFEIRDAIFADPADLPAGTTAAVRRRIAEAFGNTPVSPHW